VRHVDSTLLVQIVVVSLLSVKVFAHEVLGGRVCYQLAAFHHWGDDFPQGSLDGNRH